MNQPLPISHIEGMGVALVVRSMYPNCMRLGSNSTLWLELIGGLLIVGGVVLAWLAFSVSNQNIDPNLDKALLRFRLDFPGFLEGIARHVSAVGAGLAGFGAVLFFGASYLVQAFRWLMALGVLFALGVWLRLLF